MDPGQNLIQQLKGFSCFPPLLPSSEGWLSSVLQDVYHSLLGREASFLKQKRKESVSQNPYQGTSAWTSLRLVTTSEAITVCRRREIIRF